MPFSRLKCICPALLALLLPIQIRGQQAVPAQPVRTPAQSSTSATGQFTIHGTDLATRGAFCLLCDDVAAALGRLLRDEGRYTLPVVIVLKSPPDASLTGPAVTWNISQLAHGGFHLQINATLRPDFRADDFAKELVRVLLAERILRSHKELKTSRQNVLPNWVLTGVTHALEFRGRSHPSVLFAAVFRSGQIFSLDKIFSADPAQLDALARGIYETSACALVLALLDQPDGSLRFAKFLEALARDEKSDRELLRQLFPTLGASKNSLEKWWSLQMATLAVPSALESLGVDETEARLGKALTLVFDPLPEKTAKKKAATTAPAKKGEAPEPPKESARKSIFSQPSSGAPLTGGKKILFVPVSETDTDAEKTPADQPKSPGSKTSAEKAPEKKPTAKPVTASKAPAKKADSSAATAKPETPDPAKTNMLNPLNWFRPKEKSTAEPPKAEVPAKKEGPPAKKESPPPSKKNREKPAPTPQQDPPAPKREVDEPSSGGLPLEQFATVWKRDDRDKIFQRTLNQLNALKLQAHPLYRPLIGDYAAAVRLLISGKQKEASEKLASLAGERAKILETARAVESHLDWYEASQTRSYSGAFDDYLKLGDQIEREWRVRNDALSKYLDTLAKEYSE